MSPGINAKYSLRMARETTQGYLADNYITEFDTLFDHNAKLEVMGRALKVDVNSLVRNALRDG